MMIWMTRPKRVEQIAISDKGLNLQVQGTQHFVERSRHSRGFVYKELRELLFKGLPIQLFSKEALDDVAVALTRFSLAHLRPPCVSTFLS